MNKVILEKLPNNAKDTIVTKVKVTPNQKVKKGDTLFEFEGGKVSSFFKSPYTGIVDKVYFEEGDVVKLGDVVCSFKEIEDEQKQSNNNYYSIILDKIPGNKKEAKITNILVAAGDKVEENQKVIELEAAKGTSFIVSKKNGIIEKIFVEEGSKYKKDTELITLIPDVDIKTNHNFTPKNNKKEIEADIAIIGGGPGGYVSAIQAAKLGLDVILIEKEKLGGTCLNWGCIPTKALVRSAEIFNDLKNAEEYGCYVENIGFNLKKIMERKDKVVNELVSGIEYLIENHKIKLLNGAGKFIDKETILVESSSKDILVKAKDIIIATGSKTADLRVPCADKGSLIYSREALSLSELPDKMVIIGGGVIGMEFAFIFNSFGVDVTVVEYLDQILSILDEDVSDTLIKAANDKGIKIYTNSRVDEIISTEDQDCIVKFMDLKNNEHKFISSEKILISVGRRPYTENLNLGKIAVKLNDKGRGIKVNEYMETNIEHIYAIGDVTNKMQLAHVASHQGIVAVKNIVGEKHKMDYSAIPSAIFTDPEIAIVGLNEKEAKSMNIDYSVGKFPFRANGKALTYGKTEGFVKVIRNNLNDKVIGAAIIGPHATDLISELTVAVKNSLKVQDIAETVHAHPTTAEAVHEAILESSTGALHFVE